jgi:hypothetical protein
MRLMVLVSLICLVALGCGPKGSKKASVSGTIMYKGQPVNGAQLNFEGVGGNMAKVSIPTDQQGKFSSADVQTGDYKISVQGGGGNKWPPNITAEKKAIFGPETPPTIPFPKKYEDANSSDLKVTISAGSNPLTLEMKD